MQEEKPILLLGASGKLGLEIRKAIAADLPRQKLICASRSAYSGPKFPNEEWVQMDPFQAKWDLQGPIGAIVNAIGAIKATKEMPFEKIHVEMTQTILANRAALGNPRILQISAIGASPNALVDFLKTKGTADQLLQNEPDTVVIKPSIVCTPNTMLSQKLQKLLNVASCSLGKLLVPEGFLETKIQPIMGEDLGKGIAKLLQTADLPASIDFVGPTRIAFGELLALMAEANGKQVKTIALPKDFIDGFVKYFLSVWFPQTLSYDQFQLLFQDNVGDFQGIENLIGTMPTATHDFWRNEVRSNQSQ